MEMIIISARTISTRIQPGRIYTEIDESFYFEDIGISYYSQPEDQISTIAIERGNYVKILNFITD
ncbi:hypothetical protein C0J52_12803 [Blattella germanica]|nr:hypothetical protein C0J52_12803 [Blattella germanica]